MWNFCAAKNEIKVTCKIVLSKTLLFRNCWEKFFKHHKCRPLHALNWVIPSLWQKMKFTSQFPLTSYLISNCSPFSARECCKIPLPPSAHRFLRPCSLIYRKGATCIMSYIQRSRYIGFLFKRPVTKDCSLWHSNGEQAS